MPAFSFKQPMKRAAAVFLIVLSMISCPACGNKNRENDAIQYQSGIFHDKNWDKTIGTYTGGAVIPDAETAVKIAEAVFDGMKKSQSALEYTVQSVFFDTEDEIWIVSFWRNSNEAFLGGDCSIAMRKEDGKVLRIWFGE